MEPDDITPGQGRENWSVDGHPLLLQDLHPRRLPDLAERAHHPPPALPVPPVDLRPRRQRPRSSSARPPGRCPSCRSTVDDEGYLVAQSDFTEPVGPSFWERDSTSMSIDTSKVASTQRRRTPATAQEAQPRSARSPSWADDRLGLATAGEEEPAQGLPRPLVVHARRDRAVELRRPAAHRRLPDPVVHARAWARSTYDGSYDQLRGIHDVRGLRLDACTSPSTSAAAC